MLTWKAFWSTLTVVVTGCFAATAYLIGVPTWLTFAVQAGAGALFVGLARAVIDAAPMFAQVSDTGRRQITRLIGAGAAAHVAWMVAVRIRPDLWGIWALSLILLGLLQYWAARGHQYVLTQLVREPRKPAAAGGAEPDRYTRILTSALTRAGFSWLTVLRWEPVTTSDGRAFGVRVWVRMPSRLALQTAGEKGEKSALSPASAEPIAIGLAEVLRREILSEWVQVQKEPAAGTYKLVIVTEDVMGRVYPWVDVPQWASITTPKVVGYQIDGQPYELRLDQMGQISGATRNGKSSLVHVEFAQVSLCGDAVIWVAGVVKLYDLVGGWLEPYTGTGHPLPFDWVAAGQADLLSMLVAALTVARWRQRQPMRTRHGFKKILVYLDEASFAMRNTQVRATYEGVAYTAAQLLGMCTQATGSAEIHFRYISQRGVNSHYGDQGGDTTANAAFAAAFRTKDAGDVGRLTGDYRIPIPRHKGEFILEAGDDPVRLKAPYIQEVDPSKPTLHDGPTIADVAWTRRTFVRELDTGSAAAAGDTYAGRHTRMGLELLAYLTDTEVADPDTSTDADTDAQVDTSGPDYRDTPGYQAAMAGLKATGKDTPLTAGRPAGAPVVALEGRRSRAARIEAIVAGSAVPLSKADIVAALRATGDHGSDQVITNALNKLVTEERLTRPDRGMYVHAR